MIILTKPMRLIYYLRTKCFRLNIMHTHFNICNYVIILSYIVKYIYLLYVFIENSKFNELQKFWHNLIKK